MNKQTVTVYVVDDEESVRLSIKWLLNSISLNVETFDSAQAFLESNITCPNGCVILDVRMQNMSGLQLQSELITRGFNLPVIFLSAYGDAQIGAQTIRNGAVDFLQKPYRNQNLLDAVSEALKISEERQKQQLRRKKYIDYIDSLSPREREIFDFVAMGKSSKVIARILEISPKTVEAHRGRMIKKLGIKSTTDLVQIALLTKEHCRTCKWLELPELEPSDELQE